jgi:hypothetical protein
MTSSVTELTAESRKRSTPAVDYRELLSVAGTLPVIEPGAFYHYPDTNFFLRLLGKQDARSPSYAIGLTADMEQDTFYLVGSTGEQIQVDAVQEVKGHLEKVERAAAKAIRLTLEVAAQRTRDDTQEEGPAAAIPHNEELTDVSDAIAAVANDGEAQDAEGPKETAPSGSDGDKDPPTQPMTRVAQLQARLDAAETALETAEADYFDALNQHPGIVVARWSESAASGANARAGGIFRGATSKQQTHSGFVVMGGLRMSMLYFGSDFQMFVRALDDEDVPYFKRLGITTFILQTRHAAYTSNQDLEELHSIVFEASPNQLRSTTQFLNSIDKIRIASYFARVSSLQNSATLSGMNWKTVDRPMVDIVALEDADRPLLASIPGFKEREAERKGTGLEWARLDHNAVFDSMRLDKPPRLAVDNSDRDWQTVYAVIGKAPALYKHWGKTDDLDTLVYKVGERRYVLADYGLRSLDDDHAQRQAAREQPLRMAPLSAE